MAKFVSREKLSKKARKELDNQKRTVWAFSPTTKKVESKKLYNRKKSARAWKDDFGMSAFFYTFILHSSVITLRNTISTLYPFDTTIRSIMRTISFRTHGVTSTTPMPSTTGSGRRCGIAALSIRDADMVPGSMTCDTPLPCGACRSCKKRRATS